jgi:hypothetical protein
MTDRGRGPRSVCASPSTGQKWILDLSRSAERRSHRGWRAAGVGQKRKSSHANLPTQSGHCVTPQSKPVANGEGIRDDAGR